MIQVSDSEDELEKFSGVRAFRLVVTRIASNSEEEEKEIMPLERKKGLHELLVGRAKGSAPKDALWSQIPPTLPLPPPSSVNPFAPTNLKKRKKENEVVKEGELVPYNEEVPFKLPRMAKDKGRASLVESKKGRPMAEECLQNPTWNHQLELDGAAIPWNSTIKEFQKRNAHYLTDAPLIAKG